MTKNQEQVYRDVQALIEDELTVGPKGVEGVDDLATAIATRVRSWKHADNLD